MHPVQVRTAQAGMSGGKTVETIFGWHKGGKHWHAATLVLSGTIRIDAQAQGSAACSGGSGCPNPGHTANVDGLTIPRVCASGADAAPVSSAHSARAEVDSAAAARGAGFLSAAATPRRTGIDAGADSSIFRLLPSLPEAGWLRGWRDVRPAGFFGRSRGFVFWKPLPYEALSSLRRRIVPVAHIPR